MTTLMWEVKAAPAQIEELVAFVERHADPTADVYRSADGRVVVIDPTGHGLTEVPAELVARAPHVWRFDAVPRTDHGSAPGEPGVR